MEGIGKVAGMTENRTKLGDKTHSTYTRGKTNRRPVTGGRPKQTATRRAAFQEQQRQRAGCNR